MKNNIINASIILLVLVVNVPAFADINQAMELPSSWNPVGSGARAMGMGGAFIAVADDATAASWNPAGLIQLEKPEISVVGTAFYIKEDAYFGTNPEANGTQNFSDQDINYFSLVYPFTLLGRNMVTSINYQQLYDFTRSMDVYLEEHTANSTTQRYISQDNDGKLGAIGLAFSVQVTPAVSLGCTINLWEDWFHDNGWEESMHDERILTIRLPTPPNPPGTTLTTRTITQAKTKYSFSGVNANLGVVWNVNDRLTMGAVLKTPFTADLKEEYTRTLPLASAVNTSNDQEIEMPMSYGLGISYRFSDSFTSSADIYITEWDNFKQKDSQGNTFSPITSLPMSESHIDKTVQARMGLEYLIIGPNYIVPIRTGVFYDPAPAMHSPDDYYGITMGSGFAKGRYVFDIAYQYRWGNDVGASIHRDFDFSTDVQEHKVYMSFIIHF
ncbi:MAG: hypothetical protein GY699_24050 [Desulfobacteraceae bacterium]|nr:hypothetical protein [Desulfobacteraceae bacterium]